MTEFELAVKAKAGDRKALEDLWAKYRNVCMGILYKVAHLEPADLEAEAYIVFAHKLFDLFDPAKIGVKPESWTFSFMVTGGMKNLRSRLINESKKYNENVPMTYIEGEGEDEEDQNQDRTNCKLYGMDIYNLYNPERLVIANEEPLDERVKEFYSKLSAFEKNLLVERRAGLKLQEIADKLGCSLSKVKTHLKMAKDIASQVFEVAFA